jgi:hypothetical protein
MSGITKTSRTLAIDGALAALSFLWPAQLTWVQAGAPPAQAPAPVDQITYSSVEPLTSGPIHEAFAEPPQYVVSKPLIVSEKPPDPIDEVPPDVRPEGDNVVWINGYWGWDDDRRQFIWISGVWRDAPPGQVWVSGYWTPVSNGYQWVPGFWTAADNQELNYLPEPPAAPAEGRSSPQPDENAFWAQGNWAFDVDHYVWRPGYWSQMNPNWIWQPAHYLWTPRGYLFVAGYWDRLLRDRGLLFTPVAFTRPIYTQPGFTFVPQIVFEPGLLTTNFFVRPDYCHYFFGDFYGATYTALGFQPWFNARLGTAVYDPLFAYYRTYFVRRDPDWANRLEQRFTFLSAHPEARPPRSFFDAERIAARGNQVDAFTSIAQNTAVVAAPLDQVVNRTAAFSRDPRIPGVESLRLGRVTPEQRQSFEQRAIGDRQFAQRRATHEQNRQPGRNALNIGPLVSGNSQRPGQRVVQRPNVPETATRENVPRINEPINRTPGEVRPGVTGPTVTRPGEVAPRAMNPREVNPREVNPRQVNPGDVNPRELAPRETVPRTVGPREGVPNEVMPRIATPREVAPREVTPREVTPRDVAPRTVTPREPTPREVAPREAAPREAVPRNVAPREVTPPREAVPRETAPRTAAREPAARQPAPRETAPRPAAPPREAAPRAAAPPREPAPREAKPAPREEKPAEPPKRDGK